MYYILESLITAVPAGAIAFLICRRNKKDLKDTITIVLFVMYLAALFTVTLLSGPRSLWRSVSFVPFQSLFFENGQINERGVLFMVLNVLMFVPMGVFLRILNKPAVKTVFIGGGVSALIEILQYIFIRGMLDIDDLISNVLGVVVGCCLYYFASTVLNKKRAGR